MTSELLRLTVLGCATPYPSVDDPCSGYLVSGRGTRVWVDGDRHRVMHRITLRGDIPVGPATAVR